MHPLRPETNKGQYLSHSGPLRNAARGIFFNVAGGVRAKEPAADLGVMPAIASSYLEGPLGSDAVIVGEVGLTGEVRVIGHADARVRESAKLGFRRAVIPAANARQWSPSHHSVGCRRLLENHSARLLGGASPPGRSCA